MRSILLLLCATSILPLTLHAARWQVGPGQTYTLPSQVSTLVGDGDTVDIAAATYTSDVCAWTANDLLLRGVGGYAWMDANGAAWDDKAIWVVQGDRTTVEYIEFSDCFVADLNGAGIRLEGHHLTVRNSYFHLNQNGILTGAISPCNITIENSEFRANGNGGGGFAHNLYIGGIDTLFFRYNYSHHTQNGHEIKTRANVNFIEYNRFSNELNGSASYEIDIPNGGEAYIIGNMVHQGNQGTNSSMIAYGEEGLSSTGPHELYVINNTLLNTRTVGKFFFLGSADHFVKIYNNILAGEGDLVNGGFLPLGHDTLGNVQNEVFANFNFVDVNGFDYRILAGSLAEGRGYPAGLSNSGYPLVAWDEYVHPAGSTVRCQHALLDAGAFEICTVGVEAATRSGIQVWPVPFSDRLYAQIEDARPTEVSIMDAQGRRVHSSSATAGTIQLDLEHLATGCYVLQITSGNGSHQTRIVKQ